MHTEEPLAPATKQIILSLAWRYGKNLFKQASKPYFRCKTACTGIKSYFGFFKKKIMMIDENKSNNYKET